MYYEYPESPEAYTFNKQVCLIDLNDLHVPVLFDSTSLGQI
jgi:hypothetical protein